MFQALKMKTAAMVPYNVPTVPPDLRPEESIMVVCDSLQYLEQVASDVFARIGTRVGENRAQLAKLNARIAVAQAKIDRIKGTNRATRVFSSAKYPGTDEERKAYESIFTNPSEHLRQPKMKKIGFDLKFPAMDEKASVKCGNLIAYFVFGVVIV